MKTIAFARVGHGRKQSNFGSGTAKPKNFPAKEDGLVTRISGGVISGPAINGRDEMVYGGGPRRKRNPAGLGPLPPTDGDQPESPTILP